MPDLRPAVAPEQVLALLNQHFSTPITDLKRLEGGQISRTFAFRAGELEYVVRFNKDNMLTSNLPKEAYVARKLAHLPIPIPPILHVGRLGELYFAISRKVSGQMLETLSPQEVRELVPQMLEILGALHQVDTSDTRGYGVFDYQGQGMASSWHGFLALVGKEEDDRDYFGKWYHLFEDTFLERDLYKDLYQRMHDLLKFCPEDRYLLHSGISLRNMLARDGKISAVLDWVDARYGDFVYDIAVLDFWSPWLGVRDAFQAYHRQRQREIPFYAERLLCYECHHALGGLRFFAASGNEEGYRMTRTIILQKLEQSMS